MPRLFARILATLTLLSSPLASAGHGLQPPPQALAPPTRAADKIDSALTSAMANRSGPYTVLVVFTKASGTIAGFHVKNYMATGHRSAQEIRRLSRRKDVGSIALQRQPELNRAEIE